MNVNVHVNVNGLLLAALASLATACQLAVPPKDDPIAIAAPRVTGGASIDANPDHVRMFAGHPARAYDVRALVASCAVFESAAARLREQTVAAGGDAIVELTTYGNVAEGSCVSGVAVRLGDTSGLAPAKGDAP